MYTGPGDDNHDVVFVIIHLDVIVIFNFVLFSCFVLFRPELVERWLMGIQRRAGTQTEPAAGAAIESDDYDARDDHQVQRQVQVTSSSSL